jgi:uncharacterized protein YbaP (TraB family)
MNRCSSFDRAAGARAVAVAVTVMLLHGAAVEAQPARNFLWKVSRDKGVVYLVGSVHLLTKDYYPLSPALDTAFKDSDLLLEEADLGEMEAPAAQFTLLTRGLLPAGQSLEKVVSAATYALVTKRVAELGLPIEPLKRFKPWMLALTLVQMEWQKAGFDASLGLDRHFYDRARAEGKRIEGFETVEYQVSLFDGMTMEEQDRMLADSLEDVEQARINVFKLTDAWKAGDVRALEQIVVADLKDDPLLYQRLLVDRNRNWLPKIETLFTRTGRAFVVVGAAHLIGPDGLLSMLQAKGYTVEQL